MPFLPETLASVSRQSFRDFEVIISDNFSTDSTAAEIEAWRGNNPELRCSVVKPERPLNMGENWFCALAPARGTYVKLLMADDILDPDCIKNEVNALQARPEACMVSAPRWVGAADGTRLFLNYCLSSDRGYTLAEVLEAAAARGTNVVGEPSIVMFRRSSLAAVRQEIVGACEYLCDFALYLGALQTGTLWFLGEPGATFRVHGKGGTVTRQKRLILELERLLTLFGGEGAAKKFSWFRRVKAGLRCVARSLIYWWVDIRYGVAGRA